MKKLQVTAFILALTLGAGALTACSSKVEEESQASISTETEEESIATESEAEESTETVESAEAEDTLLEAVLQHITVARVDSVQEDGTLELTLFEVNQENAMEDETVSETEKAAELNASETAKNETTDAENEVSETETATETDEKASTESEGNTEEETAVSGTEVQLTEEDAEQAEFDFTSLDLSIFVETDVADSYQMAENTVVRMVVDGTLAEATLADIQEGDMLVFFTDAEEVTNIIIYRNEIEAVVEE